MRWFGHRDETMARPESGPAAAVTARGSVKVERGFKQTVWEYFKAIVWALAIALLIKQFLFQAFRIPTGSMKNTLLVGDFLFVDKFLYGAKTPERIRIFHWTLVDGLPVLKLPALRQPRQGDIIVFEYPKDRDLDYIKRCVAVAGDRVAVRDGVTYVNGEIYESNFGDRDGDHSCVPDWRDPDVCPNPRTLHDPVAYRQGMRQPNLKETYNLALGLAEMRGHDNATFVATAAAAVRAGVLDTAAVRPHLAALQQSLAKHDLPAGAVVQHQDAIIQESVRHDAPFVVPNGHLFMMGDNRFNSQDSRYWGPLSLKLIKGKAEILYWSWDKDSLRPRLGRLFHLIK